MFYKQIFRNWLPCLHFFIGALMFLFFLFLLYLSNGKFDWRLFTMGALTLNTLNIGYYNFGFSFDYYKLLNYKSEIQIKKYLKNQFMRIVICVCTGTSIMMLSLFVSGNIIDENILRMIICAICLIPIQIVLYIILFKKIDLFDNKFIIIKQTALNYFVPMLQIGFINLFYFLINSITYSIILLLLIHVIFFYKLNSLVFIFIKKINDEYIGS